ncbi:hypothetical protein XA26_28270 [Mycolicibacterium fortuitum]|uniref:Uncharacterized protein n=1 Tax=Mycolicibacterium fortuitum TaxID=1766 RepID=A0A0N9Y9P6_MYCFO|nr:hypothetical protein G155_00136 [Mycobacterium sp. VKM Ac-1817D]ALI26662.1 hypothetical protein XA26_28270 [Mycolicibacterium fortuitum]
MRVSGQDVGTVAISHAAILRTPAGNAASRHTIVTVLLTRTDHRLIDAPPAAADVMFSAIAGELSRR